MSLTELPTDNLYKFLAIGGLLVSIASFGFYAFQLAELDVAQARDKANTERVSDLVDVNLATSEALYAPFKRAQEEIIEEIKRASELERTPENDELFDAAISRATRLIEEVERFQVGYNDRQLPSLQMAHEAMIANAELGARIQTIRWMSPWLFFFGISGALVASAGFALWYFMLQRYQDEATLAQSKSLRRVNPIPPLPIRFGRKKPAWLALGGSRRR